MDLPPVATIQQREPRAAMSSNRESRGAVSAAHTADSEIARGYNGISITATPIRNISDIVVGKRHRKQMGDVKSLARSIEALGLLHPVVIDKGTG